CALDARTGVLVFLTASSTTDIYPLSLTTLFRSIDAAQAGFARVPWDVARDAERRLNGKAVSVRCLQTADGGLPGSSSDPGLVARSGEHTSELQSLTNLVCRLLLDNNKHTYRHVF